MTSSAPNSTLDRSSGANEISSAIILEARNLRKVYGGPLQSLNVLQDANLELKRGEMVASVAPSGAGKSTLLHL